ncbi:MAG: HNH endonuclease [Methanobacterium sp.]
MSRSPPVPEPVKKAVYAKARGMCAFENCRKDLVLEATENNTAQVGKIAHIIASSPKGPRADPNYPKEKINSFENLILLCPNHHDEIDLLIHKYPAEKLREIKRNHESWLDGLIDDGMSEFGFYELGKAVEGIKEVIESKPYNSEEDFHLITPDDKISKNSLSKESRGQIIMALRGGEEVRKFFNDKKNDDPHFPDIITLGFQKKYLELKSQGFAEDMLFKEMVKFAEGGTKNNVQQAASLAILCHLFELCEVFEK